MANEPPPPIRVLVVDDSFFMRKMLREILAESDGAVTVVDTAQNGLEAVEKCKTLAPDVVTLDVEMPRMDGLAALEKIMMECPTPVVMLSSHTGEGTETTIQALELGAIDCVAKPSGRLLENVRGIQAELVEKIKMAALIRPRYRGPAAGRGKTAPAVPGSTAAASAVPAAPKPATFLLAVASSTGGPRALNDFFSKVKPHSTAAFVVVQHISVGFTKALARRIGEITPWCVSEAQEDEGVLGGHIYLAPAGSHLVVEGGAGHYFFAFEDLPPRLGVKPSADILMTSVAKAAGPQCLGVVLTGMGRDGTAGIKDIHSGGGKTFAQDADSCVVYGMPKSAVESGAVDRQLTLERMAEEINVYLSRL